MDRRRYCQHCQQQAHLPASKVARQLSFWKALEERSTYIVYTVIIHIIRLAWP
jgi:hypothetical protein